jgi:hypothetical protein
MVHRKLLLHLCNIIPTLLLLYNSTGPEQITDLGSIPTIEVNKTLSLTQHHWLVTQYITTSFLFKFYGIQICAIIIKVQ